jgi:electron transfer flavoprotein alpha subunit
LELDLEREAAQVGLSQARIVVAAGRGIGDERGFSLVQRLAAALHGQVAGSRGAVETGWIDAGQLVGLSGHMIRPDLYVACGISGAVQHCFGLQDCGFLVAVNSDERAPIMNIANVGAVGDAQEIVEALIEALENGI